MLMDSSKFGMISTFHICDLSEIDIVVSDGGLPERFLEECSRQKIPVL